MLSSAGNSSKSTHFLGVQLAQSQQVLESIRSVQAALVAHTPGLEACNVPASTAHIALVGLHLSGAPAQQHAERLLYEELQPLLQRKGTALIPFDLQLQGLVCFPETPQGRAPCKVKSLHLAVQDDTGHEQLLRLREAVLEIFEKEGLAVQPATARPFQARAEICQTRRSTQRKSGAPVVKHIPAEAFCRHLGCTAGLVHVSELQLCSLTREQAAPHFPVLCTLPPNRALGNKSNTVPPADGNRKQQQQQQHHGQRQDQRLDWEQQQDQQSACLLAGTATGQKRSAEQGMDVQQGMKRVSVEQSKAAADKTASAQPITHSGTTQPDAPASQPCPLLGLQQPACHSIHTNHRPAAALPMANAQEQKMQALPQALVQQAASPQQQRPVAASSQQPRLAEAQQPSTAAGAPSQLLVLHSGDSDLHLRLQKVLGEGAYGTVFSVDIINVLPASAAPAAAPDAAAAAATPSNAAGSNAAGAASCNCNLLAGLIGRSAALKVAKLPPKYYNLCQKFRDQKLAEAHGAVQREVRVMQQAVQKEGGEYIIGLYAHGTLSGLPSLQPDAPDLPCLLMERAAGGSVGTFVQQHGPLPERLAFHISAQAGRAMAALHYASALWRDCKGENLLLMQPLDSDVVRQWGQQEGAADEGAQQVPVVVKICDFGIAAEMEGVWDLRYTQNQGTLGYMAPEQVLGHGAAHDVRCDVYALGATLLELLTGRRCRPPARYDASFAAVSYDVDTYMAQLAEEHTNFDHLSFEAKAVIKLCFQRMAERPTINYILRHCTSFHV